MGRPGYPPNLFHRGEGAITVPASKIVPATAPAYDGSSVLFVERAAVSAAGGTTKPWPAPLCTSDAEGPFLF